MFLELSLRDKKQHHKVDRLIIKGIEIYPLLRSAEGTDDFCDQISRGVGDADAETDSGAHRRFALLDDRRDGFAVLRLDLSGAYEISDEFINGFPPVGCLQIWIDLLAVEDISQIHTKSSAFRLNSIFISRPILRKTQFKLFL